MEASKKLNDAVLQRADDIEEDFKEKIIGDKK
jgi:hypothetical protein